jgi:tetratricopeptide (TPR) repeat protein
MGIERSGERWQRTAGITATPSIDALFQQAFALHQGGQVTRARALYEEVLRLRPRHFDALHLSGVIAAQSNDLSKAHKLISKAIALDPHHALIYAAHRNLGLVLKQMQRLEAALLSFNRAIAHRADFAEAYFDRATALLQLERLEAALADFERVIALKGDHAESHYHRAQVLLQLQRPAPALPSIERAIELMPGNAEAHCHRGNALAALGRHEEALASFERALALQPNHAGVCYNRANLLKQMSRWPQALASYEQALAINPDYAEAHVNRGVLLHEQRQLGAALAAYERALAIRPRHAGARFNRACLLLLRGEYERGWEEFEWRWQSGWGGRAAEPRRPSQPQWTGTQPLAGKSILLHAEQGLGDTLQFCRYVPLVAQLGARVILEVQPPLLGLLSRLQGVWRLRLAEDPISPADYHCPLMSLPRALGTTLTTIPAPRVYLCCDAQKARFWEQQLGFRQRPRVGLVWSGGFRRDHPELWAVNERRNIPLVQLAELLRSDVEFFSLQKGQPAQAELERWRATVQPGQIIDHTAWLHDFDDTAALIEQLDLVISVDTSTAHLAGALGKPVWILNRFDGCWRWLLDRRDSPWYPSARLYRQPAPGDWHGVIEQAAADLGPHLFPCHCESRAGGATPGWKTEE